MEEKILSLDQKIGNAKKSEGYLIMITRRNNKQLFHSFFTQRFLDSDVPIALECHEKMLNEDIGRRKSATFGDSAVEKKELPPEYRR